MPGTLLSPAGLRSRILAFALDYLIILAYLGALTIVAFALGRIAPSVVEALFRDALSGQITVFLALTLPVALYFAWFESSPRQATPGKRRMGLVVTDRRGQRLSRARSFGRTALKLLPWELAHTCIWQLRFAADPSHPIYTVGLAVVWLLVGANLISLWVSPARQTVYDRLAGAVVVR